MTFLFKFAVKINSLHGWSYSIWLSLL